MKFLPLGPALALLAAIAPCAPAAPAPPVRQRTLMDAGWRFQRASPVALKNAAAITSWRWQFAASAQAAVPAPDTSGPAWQPAAVGTDVFGLRPGFAWFQATLPDTPGPRRTLHFDSVDDNATVYLNGRLLVHHEGWNDPFDVPLDAAWRAGGPNTVAVLVQNNAGGGGVMKPVTLGAEAVSAPAADPAQPGFSDRAWRVVHLPHDYVVEGAFTPAADASHGSLPTMPAWYRKTFPLPASDRGRSVWIDFDGVYRDAKVYLNGRLLGEHPSGYTGFRFDISRAARFGGLNTLAVHVDPTKQEGWWYEGGGIYRHVWLNVAAPVHVAPDGVFVSTRMPEPVPGRPAAPATVRVQTTVEYPDGIDGNAAFTLVSRVLDPAGRVVGTAAAPADFRFGERTVPQRVTVARPLLWSVETPRLYTLHTEIRQGARVVDAADTPFGIRTIRFDAQRGFFLNGRPVKIKGTCNHQDFAGVGIAVPDTLEAWRVRTLKAMGSNAWRTSHNPPTASLLDACDREGMLVMDENRHLGDTQSPKSSVDTPYADLSELRSMVLRDRNHPSVIMWSMCNEEFGTQATAAGARIFAAMKKVTDAADGTRPVTCAMNGGYDSPVGITSVEDLQGINYAPRDYDRVHQAHPALPVYGSETSSEVGTRGVYGPDTFTLDRVQYLGDQAKGYVTAYDLNAPGWAQTAENAWQPIAARPFVAGGYVWTGFDYKGEPTPFAWPDVNSNFGILDECGFPKDDYYYYKAWWGGQPTVHLLPHWNWAGQEGKPIRVWCYGNAARVELRLNGRSLGTQDMPAYRHAEWSVPYTPGRLEARGYDAAGRLVATDTVETTGVPAALRLSAGRTALSADGEDVAVVDVAVVDAGGRVVPTADTRVTFAVTGAGTVAGVGNGDPSDHDPDKAGSRRAFHGLCLALVGAKSAPGRIRLTATAPGLKPVALTLTAR